MTYSSNVIIIILFLFLKATSALCFSFEHPVLQVALQCNSDRLPRFLQKLLQELLQCLDSHRSLAPQQLLSLLRLYLAGLDKSRKQPQTLVSSSKESKNNCSKSEQLNRKSENICEGSDKVLHANGSLNADIVNAKNNNKNIDIVHVDRSNKSTNATLGPIAAFLLDHHAKKLDGKASLKKEQDEALRAVEDELSNIDEDSTAGSEGFKQHVKDKASRDPLNVENEAKDIKRNDPKDAPKDIQLIVNILERCCFLLHTRDRDVALVLLDTIELGCLALRDWENNQLPVLHKVWKPLLLRIKDTDTIVTLRAITVCCIMVTSSGDFLRKRCLQELLPLVNKFLSCQSAVSLNKTVNTGYLMSAAYLTQKRLLETLYPDLITGLKLGPNDMTEAVCCCLDYLNSSQPPELVDASLGVLKRISVTNRAHVWLALAHCVGPITVTPPSTHLCTIKVRAYTVCALP